jgi:dynein heavy chain
VYWPVIAKSNEWNNVLSDEQRRDFELQFNKFVNRLRHGIAKPRDDLELKLPPLVHSFEMNTNDEASVMTNQDIINVYSSVLEDWCDKSELLLSQYHDQQVYPSMERYDEGPKGEIDYWYECMQHFSMIIEQSKRTECKKILETVLSLIKGCSDHGASKLSLLLRRWKKCEMDSLDALNEAKDNFKYLQTLERFVEPLSMGSTQTIIDMLPALLNSVKVSVT